jgi:hypothetical protein
MLAEGLIPPSAWNNAGIATPASTFETWNWAKKSGDAKTLANTLAFDMESKAKADALFASLSESRRAQFGSPEEMFATMSLHTTTVAGMRVLSQESLGSDEAVLRTQWQYDDGRIRTNDLRFHRYDDGWRQVIPGGIVDKLGGMINNPDLGK